MHPAPSACTGIIALTLITLGGYAAEGGPVPDARTLATRLAAIAGEPVPADQHPCRAFVNRLHTELPVAAAWFAPLLPDRPADRPAEADVPALLRRALDDLAQELDRRGGAGHALAVRAKAATATAGLADLVAEAGLERRRLRLARLCRDAPHIVFAKRHDIRPSFIGYTEGLSDARTERHFQAGTALCQLDLTERDAVTRELISDPLGMIRDPDVSFAGDRILFAWKKSDRNDDYHLYECDPASHGIRQLTFGLGCADYEGAYLPDGGIVFASSRVEHSVPCWMTEVSGLYRMDGDGRWLHRLAIDQVHTLYPKPTEDGRIVYTRWDYNDRGQNYPHPLFTMNLDGTGQAALYGANSWFPTSQLHTRPIPGTQRFLCILSGHHTPQQGKVVEVDPAKGRDEGPGLAFVAPKRDYPYERVDRAMQFGEVFAFPFPLGDEEFLAARAPTAKDRFELFWFSYDGGREWLAGDPILSCLHPVALRPRARGHVRPDTVRYGETTGTVFIHDVYQGDGMQGVPRGTAKRLRVVEVRYRCATVGGTGNGGKGGGSFNGTPVAVAQGTWDIKAIIGETPIHSDGSVLVTVPAMKSLYYQVLDAQGHVVQTMRSWDTMRPGEVKSCVGCHSYAGNAAPPAAAANPIARQVGPATLEPFSTGWTGFSFPRHIQPILDAKCVSCHDGSDPKRMDLRGEAVEADQKSKRAWSRAYLSLTAATQRIDRRKNEKDCWSGNPDGPWVKFINKMGEPTVLPALSAGSAKSPLMAMLRSGHGGKPLTDEEYRRVAAWIDLLVPFSGEYREGAAWSGRDEAFYTYYEDKRRLNKLDEAEEERRHRDLALTPAVTLAVRQRRAGTVIADQKAAGDDGVSVTLALPHGLQAGDELAVEGACALGLHLVGWPEAEVHMAGRHWVWTVPTTAPLQATGFTVHALSDGERSAYRNLAANPFAGAEGAFPAIAASSASADAVRVIASLDGPQAPSWRAAAGDATLTVDLGRMARIDRIVVSGSGGSGDAEIVVDERKVGTVSLGREWTARTVTFPPVEGQHVGLRHLRTGATISAFAIWGLDADRTPAARIANCKEKGGLAAVPLQ